MKRPQKWWVAEGYDQDGQLLAYFVVRGTGTNPKELEFDGHGAYILKSAAQETCDVMNSSKKYEHLVQRLVGATLKRVSAA